MMPIEENILRDIKTKYNIDTYFETGLSRGKGVDAAISANFRNIYSIDICKRWIDKGCKKYNQPFVHLILGDSQNIYDYIKGINNRILFFLDAHNDHSNLDGENSTIDCPIGQELEAIKSHHINNHIIVVDDINIINSKQETIVAKGGEFKGRHCVNWGKNVNLESIKNKILEINSYKFKAIKNQLLCTVE